MVETFIARIKEVNPILNCVVDERFNEALEDAHKVDEFIQSGVKSVEDIEKDTPFLGVPFSTKDCIQVTGMTIKVSFNTIQCHLISKYYLNSASMIRIFLLIARLSLEVHLMPFVVDNVSYEVNHITPFIC